MGVSDIFGVVKLRMLINDNYDGTLTLNIHRMVCHEPQRGSLGGDSARQVSDGHVTIYCQSEFEDDRRTDTKTS